MIKVLMPYISCIVTTMKEFEEAKKNYSEVYFASPYGNKKYEKLTHGRSIVKSIDEIPGFKADETEIPKEEINFLPAGKVPYKLFEQIVEFFKEVMRVKNAPQEAMAHILWNPTDGYHIAIPNQSISPVSVNYDWIGHIKPGDVLVVDIHSHNNMRAFFSGTDNKDDRDNISFSGVVGHLDKSEYMTCWRFNLGEKGKTIDCNFEDVFLENSLPKFLVPKEWIEKVNVPKVKPLANRPLARLAGQEEPTLLDLVGSGYTSPNKAASLAQRQADMLDDWGFKGETDGRKYVSIGEWARDSKDTNDYEFQQQRAEDTPGYNDYLEAQYGAGVAEAVEQIETFIEDLEEADEPIQDLIQLLFNKMSVKGQAKIQTYGIN